VGFVVAGAGLLIVRKIAVFTYAEIGYASILASDGICSMSILIVAVSIIVVDILQCRHIGRIIGVIANASLEIIGVEIIGYTAIFEVGLSVGTIRGAKDIVEDRGEWRRNAIGQGWILLEAAMV